MITKIALFTKIASAYTNVSFDISKENLFDILEDLKKFTGNCNSNDFIVPLKELLPPNVNTNKLDNLNFSLIHVLSFFESGHFILEAFLKNQKKLLEDNKIRNYVIDVHEQNEILSNINYLRKTDVGRNILKIYLDIEMQYTNKKDDPMYKKPVKILTYDNYNTYANKDENGNNSSLSISSEKQLNNTNFRDDIKNMGTEIIKPHNKHNKPVHKISLSKPNDKLIFSWQSNKYEFGHTIESYLNLSDLEKKNLLDFTKIDDLDFSRDFQKNDNIELPYSLIENLKENEKLVKELELLEKLYKQDNKEIIFEESLKEFGFEEKNEKLEFLELKVPNLDEELSKELELIEKFYKQKNIEIKFEDDLKEFEFEEKKEKPFFEGSFDKELLDEEPSNDYSHFDKFEKNLDFDQQPCDSITMEESSKIEITSYDTDIFEFDNVRFNFEINDYISKAVSNLNIMDIISSVEKDLVDLFTREKIEFKLDISKLDLFSRVDLCVINNLISTFFTPSNDGFYLNSLFFNKENDAKEKEDRINTKIKAMHLLNEIKNFHAKNMKVITLPSLGSNIMSQKLTFDPKKIICPIEDKDVSKYGTYFKSMLEQAENGEKNSQYYLALMYFSGLKGVTKNLNIAKFWFKKAAKQLHPEALFRLGCYYDNKSNVSNDTTKSFAYFLIAAKLNSPYAQYKLAVLFKKGIEVSKNLSLFKKLFKFAAENPEKIYSIHYKYALSLKNGDFGYEDVFGYKHWLNSAVRSGYEPAKNHLKEEKNKENKKLYSIKKFQKMLGSFFVQKKHSILLSNEFFKKLQSILKNKEKFFLDSYQLLYDDTLKENKDIKALNKVLFKKNVVEQHQYALKCYDKFCKKQGEFFLPFTFLWLVIAASNENTLALCELGVFLQEMNKSKHIIPEKFRDMFCINNDEILSCYKNASYIANNFRAQNLLGQAYELGQLGLPVNTVMAITCYEKSATNNYFLGLYNYARCLEFGIGRKKDLLKAYRYYKKSAKKGFEPAIEAVKKLKPAKVSAISQGLEKKENKLKSKSQPKPKSQPKFKPVLENTRSPVLENTTSSETILKIKEFYPIFYNTRSILKVNEIDIPKLKIDPMQKNVFTFIDKNKTEDRYEREPKAKAKDMTSSSSSLNHEVMNLVTNALSESNVTITGSKPEFKSRLKSSSKSSRRKFKQKSNVFTPNFSNKSKQKKLEPNIGARAKSPPEVIEISDDKTKISRKKRNRSDVKDKENSRFSFDKNYPLKKRKFC